jgi:hypothetical protein
MSASGGGWGSGPPAEMGNKSGNFRKSIITDIIIRVIIFSRGINAICFLKYVEKII